MNIKAGFKYRFNNSMHGAIIMNAIVIVLVILAAVCCVTLEGFNTAFTGSYEMVAAIMLFVYGVVTIREDLRLANQCGRGRNTAFVTNTLSNVASAAVFAVACQLISTAVSFFVRNLDGFKFATFWTMTYFGDFFPVYTLSFGEHLASVLADFGIFTAASMCGVFCSALFYKVPSKWTAVTGVAFGVAIGMGIPSLISAIVLLANISAGFGAFLEGLVYLIFVTPVNLAISALVFAVIVAAVNYLLVRRVAVRAPGEKG